MASRLLIRALGIFQQLSVQIFVLNKVLSTEILRNHAVSLEIALILILSNILISLAVTPSQLLSIIIMEEPIILTVITILSSLPLSIINLIYPLLVLYIMTIMNQLAITLI